MPEHATNHHSDPSGSAAIARGPYLAGIGAIVIGVVALVLMQALAGDWLPPAVSFSQYALGPGAPAFVVWALSMGLAPALFAWSRRWRPRWATACLAVGVAATVLMARIPTDRGGLQQSVDAKVHMGGATVAMVLLPFGCWGLIRGIPRQAVGDRATGLRRVADGLLLLTCAALVLILVAAAGVGMLGMDSHRAWAVWQTVALGGGQFLVITVAIVLGTALGRGPTLPAGYAPTSAE